MKYLLCSFLLLSAFVVTAQNSETAEEKKRYKHNFGLGAGMTTGIGFSYRYMPDKLGAQVNFIPIIVNDSEVLVNPGVSFLYSVQRGRKVDFYLYQANSFLFNQRVFDDFSSDPMDIDSQREFTTVERTYNHGLGVGFEFLIGSQFAIDVMSGMRYFHRYDSRRDDYYADESRYGVTASIETSIHYKF